MREATSGEDDSRVMYSELGHMQLFLGRSHNLQFSNYEGILWYYVVVPIDGTWKTCRKAVLYHQCHCRTRWHWRWSSCGWITTL